jgi:2-hydroxychromene-2-carboxylate isomerase
MVQAAFYFDLQSPEAYLAAERALSALPAPCEWQPILAASLPTAEHFEGYRCEHEFNAMRESVERRAAALALQPLRWPSPFPYDSRFAMLTATYAKRVGKTVAFALAAFRQSFAGGRALSDHDTVLIAAAACEIHPAAILKATQTRSVAAELERAGAQALALGVSDVPAVRVGDVVFVGERRLEEAGALLEASRR